MDTKSVMSLTLHRPFPMPSRPWKYFQEWKGTLFLHYKVDVEMLQGLLPEGLEADLFEGSAWVSVVCFTVNRLRPRGLPPLPFASDFHETNLRTYVVKDGIPGIYFLSIRASRSLSVFLGSVFARLPYRKAPIKRPHSRYICKDASNTVDVRYVWLEDISEKTELDRWLTERYCNYQEDGRQLYRYNIHHPEWPLKNIKMPRCRINFSKGPLKIKGRPDLAQYSQYQPVLLWGREKC